MLANLLNDALDNHGTFDSNAAHDAIVSDIANQQITWRKDTKIGQYYIGSIKVPFAYDSPGDTLEVHINPNSPSKDGDPVHYCFRRENLGGDLRLLKITHEKLVRDAEAKAGKFNLFERILAAWNEKMHDTIL